MNGVISANEISKSVSSLNSPRVSVIKWIGKELNDTLISASKLDSPSAKQRCLSTLDSTVKKFISREGKYPCSYCEKSFKWRSHWESHERTHTGERPFHCAICGKSFTRSDGLQCHKVNHIKQNMKDSQWFKPHDPASWRKYNDELSKTNRNKLDNQATRLFTCSVCDRGFLSSVGLVKHFRAHKGVSCHRCEVCSKTFPKRSALVVHSRVHTGIKPYQCYFCPKTFSIRGNLKRHVLIHSKER